eukprot:PhF_6_TR8351/c0_g1_i1/m.13090
MSLLCVIIALFVSERIFQTALAQSKIVNSTTKCINANSFRFKPVDAIGARSSITQNASAFTALWDRDQPRDVIIQILTIDTDGSVSLYAGTSKIFIDISINPADDALFDPFSVQVKNGELFLKGLYFKKLVKDTTPTYLYFVARSDEIINGQVLIAGPITVVKEASREAKYLDFPEWGSFFFFRDQSQWIPIMNVSVTKYLMTIQVQLMTDVHTVLETGQGAVGVRPSNPNCILRQNESFFVSGVATFTTLSLSTNGKCESTMLIFTTSDGLTLSTGVCNTTSGFFSSDNIWFDSSTTNLIQWPNQRPIATALVGQPLPPITVIMMTAEYLIDRLGEGVVIAKASKGRLTGEEGVMRFGKVTFVDLVIVDPVDTCEITFEYHTPRSETISVNTGTISVQNQPLRNYFLTFAENSWVDEYQNRSWTKLATFPPIILRMMDSSMQFDPTGTGLIVRAHVAGGRFLEGSQATLYNGYVVFTGLRLQDISVTELTINFNVENSTTPVATNKFVAETASIQLYPQVQQSESDWDTASLRFASSQVSLVSREKQSLFATVGYTLPPIVLEVVSKIGVVYQPSENVTMRAFTSNTVTNETLFSYDVNGVQGRYRFTCLQFFRVPSSLVRITFSLKTPTGRYMNISTGYVNVLPTVVPAYATRFRKTKSVVTYEGQSLSAVKNVALPAIAFELLNSAYELDEDTSDIDIVAHTTTGKIEVDGSSVRFEKGYANFASIKYSTIGRDPVLQFDVLANPNPVSHQQLVTGLITLTERPVSNFNLELVPVDGATFSYPMQPYRPTDFFADMKVYIRLIDSAYQVDISNTDKSLKIVVTSTNDLTVTPKEVTVSNGVFRFDKLRFVVKDPPPYEIFLTFTADSPTGQSIVAGKAIVVGPISYNVITDYKTCSIEYEEPLVIAELSMSTGAINLDRDGLKLTIATLLGIEIARVRIHLVASYHDVDRETGFPRSGSKVEFSFTQPKPSSANQESSARIAAFFVSLRRRIVSNLVRSVYYKRDDVSCNIPLYTAARLQADIDCTANVSDTCGCYSDSEVFSRWMKPCQFRADVGDSVGKTLLANMKTLCNSLQDCEDSTIVDVCGEIATVVKDWTLYWAIPTAVSGVVLIAMLIRYCIRKRRQILYPDLKYDYPHRPFLQPLISFLETNFPDIHDWCFGKND